MNSNYNKYFIIITDRQSSVLLKLAKGIVFGFCLLLNSTFILAAPISNRHRKEFNIKLCSLSEIIKISKVDKTPLDDLIATCYDELENQTTEASIRDDWNKIIELTYKMIELKEYVLGIRNSYNTQSGIGISLSKSLGQYPIIKTVVSGLGADKAGIKQHDFITNINNQNTKLMDGDKLLALIKGKDKTFVKITFTRNGIVRTKKIQRNKLFRDNHINLSDFWRENMRLYTSYGKLNSYEKILELFPVTFKSYIDKHGESGPLAARMIFSQANTFFLLNKYKSSLESIDKAFENVNNKATSDDYIKYDLFSLQYSNASALNNIELEKKAIESSLAEFNKIKNTTSTYQNFSMINNIGLFLNSNSCQYAYKTYTQCLTYAQYAKDMALEYFGINSKEYVATLRILSSAYKYAGERSKAFEVSQRYIKLAEENSLEGGLLRVTALNLAALSLTEQYRNIEAEQIYRKTVKYADDFFGTNSIELIKAKLELADHLLGNSKPDEGIRILRLALQDCNLLHVKQKNIFNLNTEQVIKIKLDIIHKLIDIFTYSFPQVNEVTLLEKEINFLTSKYLKIDRSIQTVTFPMLAKIFIFRKDYKKALRSINSYIKDIYAYKESNQLFNEYKSVPLIRNKLMRSHISEAYEAKANIHVFLNEYKIALEAVQNAIKIMQESYGYNESESYRYIQLYNLAANIEILSGNFDAAKVYAKKALVLNSSFGNELSIGIKSTAYLKLGVIDAAQYKYLDAVNNFSLYLDNEYSSIYSMLWKAPSKEKRSIADNSTSSEWIFHYYKGGELINQIALKARINLHALAKEIELIQKFLLEGENSQDFKTLLQQKAMIESSTIDPNKKKELTTLVQNLEANLISLLPQQQRQLVNINEIASMLPKGSHLIEFQKILSSPSLDRFYRKEELTAKYIAYVLDSAGRVSRVDIGNADLVDAEVKSAIAATAENNLDAAQRWDRVSLSLLKPIFRFIDQSSPLYIAPDSDLINVPFAALPLPNSSGLYLGEYVSLRQIISGRDLLSNNQSLGSNNPPLIIANPDYSYNITNPVNKEATALNSLGPTDRFNTTLQWAQLPATEIEGNKIAEIFGIPLISGAQATTSKLQTVDSPKILHIASHGSFGDQISLKPETRSGNNRLENTVQINKTLSDPFIVLAGANSPNNLVDNDDGILSLAETVGLKLKGTELVVLSACDTAKGEINSGDGVLGLQRSLSLAGARSTLLSLWKVDDAATAEFMVRFYKRLKAGEGRSDALAAVQKEFRDGAAGNGQWKEPYFWAAWQLVGDWKPINGL